MIFDFLQANWFEIVAALLAIAYLVLAMMQDVRCWVAWIISSLMYLFVMYSAGLYMEALLQIFYIFIGFYGLYQWRFKSDLNESLKISVRFLSNEIRSDSLKIMIHKKDCRISDNCGVSLLPKNSKLNSELLTVILRKASLLEQSSKKKPVKK